MAAPRARVHPDADRPPSLDAPRQHPFRSVIVFVVAISLLVSGVVFALVATSTTDGASDPTTAVKDLLQAVARNDVIGILDSLPPAEREAMRNGIPALADELRRLGVLGALSLSNIPGVNIELRNVGFHTTMLWGELGRVQLVSGSIVVTPVSDGFPLPESTRQLLEHDFRASIDPGSGSHTIDLATWRPNLVAVKDGGGWHVSMFYTLAEAIRGAENGPLPRFGDLPSAVGAESPEAAVRELIEAGMNLDPTRAVTLTLPTEGRALYDYSSLFLPEARRRSMAIEADEPLSMRLQDLEVAANEHGTVRRVEVTRFDARLSEGDDQRRVTYEKGCLSATRSLVSDPDASDTVTTCDGDLAPATSLHPAGGDRLDKLTAWQGLGRAFPTFVVIERQGRWYVSPTQTVLTTLVEILRQMQPEDVQAFSARLGELAQLYGLPVFGS